MSYWTNVICKCGFVLMHCKCEVEVENLNEVVVKPIPEEVVKINGNGTAEKPVINESDKEVKEKINS